jgi:hypothetical protein
MTTDSATVCEWTVVPAQSDRGVIACTVRAARTRCAPGPSVQPVSRVAPSTTARVPITLPLATVESVTCRVPKDTGNCWRKQEPPHTESYQAAHFEDVPRADNHFGCLPDTGTHRSSGANTPKWHSCRATRTSSCHRTRPTPHRSQRINASCGRIVRVSDNAQLLKDIVLADNNRPAFRQSGESRIQDLVKSPHKRNH